MASPDDVAPPQHQAADVAGVAAHHPRRPWMKETTIRHLALAVSVVFALVSALGLAFFVTRYVWFHPKAAALLYTDQVAGVAGIPLAGLTAFCLVSILRATSEGEVEIGGFGLHFKGAAGPIVLWLFCFLAIVHAIWLLNVPADRLRSTHLAAAAAKLTAGAAPAPTMTPKPPGA